MANPYQLISIDQVDGLATTLEAIIGSQANTTYYATNVVGNDGAVTDPSWWSNPAIFGFSAHGSGSTGLPDANGGETITFKPLVGNNSSTYQRTLDLHFSRLAVPDAYLRFYNNASVPGPWRKIWDDGNFNPGLKLDLSAYTAADVLAKLLTVDGAGSGLDADTLDGYHASSFALSSASYVNSFNTRTGVITLISGDVTGALGFTPLNALSYTAADVLAKLLTVDGTGTGLDADLLDGQQGSYYSDIAARLGYTPENTANKNTANGYAGLDGSGKIDVSHLPSIAITDTFVVVSQAAMLALTAQRGDVAIRSDLNKSFILTNEAPGTLSSWSELLTPTDSVLSVAGLTGAISGPALKTALAYVIGDVSGLQGALDSKLNSAAYTAADVLSKLLTVDGVSSGLDADLLDGYQASDFPRKAEAATITNTWVFERNSATPLVIYRNNAASNVSLEFRTTSFNRFLGLNTTGDLLFGDSPDLNNTGAKIWTTGNDGASSGLDADLLDGQHGSYYAPVANPSFTGGATIGGSLNVNSSSSGYASTLATSVSEATVKIKTHTTDSIVTTIGGITGGATYIQRSNGPGTGSYPIALNPWGGNVGIGRTDPQASLDVRIVGDGEAVRIGNTSGRYLSIGAQTTPAGAWLGYAGNQHVTILASGNVGIGETAPGSRLSVSGAATIGAGYDTNAAPTNGLLVEGNVGIGTASPNQKLHVYGGNAVIQGSAVSQYWSGSQPTLLVENSGSSNGFAAFAVQTIGGVGLVNTNAGNVGIGTTVPTAKLHINTFAAEMLRLSIVTAGSGIFADNGGAFGVFSLTRQDAVANGSLSIAALGGIGFTGGSSAYNNAVASAYQMYLSPTGNVGIGATSPSVNLHVASTTNGTIRLDGTAVQIEMQAQGSTRASLGTITNHPFCIVTNNIERVTVAAAGDVAFSSSTITAGGNTMWHAANDGAASGLDADLLDGIQGSAYLRNQVLNTSSWDTKTNGVMSLISASTNGPVGATNHSGVYFPHNSGGYGFQLAARNSNLFFRTEELDTWANWNEIWHTGNMGSGSGSDADTLDGQHGSYYRDAGNLNAGILPDARLSGTYTGISLKMNAGQTIYGLPSTGTANNSARTVYDLASYRSSASPATGAIVFIAPTTESAIMHRMTIEGMIYGGPTVHAVVQGYRTSGNWSNVSKINLGITDIQVRLGVTPDGKNCVILGDVGTTWSYPHLAISHAMFSHSGASDSYCTGWTTALVTDLSLYTNVSATLANTWGYDGSDLRVGTSKVWDESNDGSGSGLDADLLDGSQRDAAFNSFTAWAIPVRGSGGNLYSNYFNMTANDTAAAATQIAVETSNDGFLRWQSPAQFITNHGIWTSANDGAGSGLDADLLDGQQGAFYQSASNLNAGTVPDARITGAYSGITTLSLSDTLTSTKVGPGDNIFLNGSTSNWITWNTNGFAAPTMTTRSPGTKLILYPAISGSNVDYGFGIENGAMWSSTGTTATSFKWYGGTTLAATLTGSGALTLTGGLTATTLAGSGASITSLNAANLTTGILPDARLSGTYTGVSISGNAGTATTLQTARTIGGVSFNGSANINLPGVNTAGNQNTTGSAATLTTGRTLAITGDLTWTSPSFNGSGNVTAAGTLATVNGNVGSFGSATQTATFTVNAKGLTTAAGNVTITPAWTSITSKPTTVSGYGITATDLRTNLLTVDGSGSGLDADLLDGQQGSYYLSATNLNDGTIPDARLPTGASKLAKELYVASRTQNLVTNGTGLLKDNSNFSGFDFDGTDGFFSTGSFKSSVYTATRFNDELIPVDPTLTYEMSLFAKANPYVGANHIMGVAMADADGLEISASQHMYAAGSTTTLAANLNPGDTTVTLTNATGMLGGDQTYRRGFIVWNYVNSLGFAYPPETYSRNVYFNLWANDAAINTSTNVITLTVPWAGPVIPSGTSVSRSNSGATYKYILGAPTVPNTWTKYSGRISGIDNTGTNNGTTFAPGTASIKLLFLINRTVNGGTLWLSNIKFGLYNGDYTVSTSGVVDYVSTPTVGGNSLFHVGNDGAGSGLDADLLDGQQGSYYLSAANLNAGVLPDARLSGTYTGVNISGNAGTATTLQTARLIGGVSFNGSSNINLPGVNTAGNQNTTGSAATLTTARTIWGQSFNGSANISGNLTGVGNITGSGAIIISAAGTNQSITLTPTGTGTVNSPTFNATSTTSGGFQGIAADSAAVPSFTWTGDLNTGMWRPAADQIGFSTGGTNRLTLSTTAFTSTVDVWASRFNIDATGYFTMSGSNPLFGYDANDYTIYDRGGNSLITVIGGTTRMTLGSTGDLSVTGDITAYSSDARLKTNVKPILNPLDKIDSIGGYTFNWDRELVDREGFTPYQYENEHGFLAQEIQKIVPDAVRPALFNSEYLTVKYERLVPLAMEGIKALREENRGLRSELDELKTILKERGII